jgi:hypothetical protein
VTVVKFLTLSLNWELTMSILELAIFEKCQPLVWLSKYPFILAKFAAKTPVKMPVKMPATLTVVKN